MSSIDEDKTIPPPAYDTLTLHDLEERHSSTPPPPIEDGDDARPRLTSADGRDIHLDFRHDGILSRDLIITDRLTGRVEYHVEVSEWIPSYPDVILRRRSKTGVVAGSAEFRMSRDVKMKLGGQGTKGGTDGIHAVLRNDSRWLNHNKYSLEIPLGSGLQDGIPSTPVASTSSAPPTLTKKILFERTQSSKDGITDLVQKIYFDNWKIQDEQTGDTLGLWLEGPVLNPSGKGNLRIFARSSSLEEDKTPGVSDMQRCPSLDGKTASGWLDEKKQLKMAEEEGEEREVKESNEDEGHASSGKEKQSYKVETASVIDEEGFGQYSGQEIKREDEIDWIVLAMASLAEKSRRR
jgi:hypothetical protein